MPYVVPTFVLPVNIWRSAAGVPPVGPPDVVTVGNLAWGRRVQSLAAVSIDPDILLEGSMTLLVPALTDIRGVVAGGTPDTVECPAGSLRFYNVVFVDDIGKGFANEHRAAVMVQSQSWPVPTP